MEAGRGSRPGVPSRNDDAGWRTMQSDGIGRHRSDVELKADHHDRRAPVFLISHAESPGECAIRAGGWSSGWPALVACEEVGRTLFRAELVTRVEKKEGLESGRGESHPPALAEPGVKVSPHRAHGSWPAGALVWPSNIHIGGVRRCARTTNRQVLKNVARL